MVNIKKGNKMKLQSLLYGLVTCSVLTLGSIFTSCSDNDGYEVWIPQSGPNAIVTVKSQDGKSCYFQLNDSVTLYPVNLSSSPYGNKEVRALLNYHAAGRDRYNLKQSIYVDWMDSILTKRMAPNLGNANDSVYGTDPVDIIDDWLTVAEDGYLTIHFKTYWSNTGKAHWVNLLPVKREGNVYEVEFRHHANGDGYNHINDALVAFKLDSLSDFSDKKIQIKLKWRSFRGTKTMTLQCNAPKDTTGYDVLPQYLIPLE